jgi:hypothetical protein
MEARIMPALTYWFSGAALGSFLALIATVSSLGYAWYRAAATESQIAQTTETTNREKQRLKDIRAKLQSFYISGGAILDRPLAKEISDEDFQHYVGEANAWAVDTRDWIEKTLGHAAAVRFLDLSGNLFFTASRAANPRHNEIINALTGYRKNLTQMIEVNAWDAGEANK